LKEHNFLIKVEGGYFCLCLGVRETQRKTRYL
jgi:hypothetical protein